MKKFQLTPQKYKGSCYAAAKSLQSCPTLCDPIDGSPPGSPVPGILQARTLEWVAISFANAWKWKVKVKSLSRVWLLATPWTAAHQAPLSMGFSRQECWSVVPLPSPCLNMSTFQMSQWSKLQFWKVCASRDSNPRYDWGDRLPREMWQKDATIYAAHGVELNSSLKNSSPNVISTADPDPIC